MFDANKHFQGCLLAVLAVTLLGGAAAPAGGTVVMRAAEQATCLVDGKEIPALPGSSLAAETVVVTAAEGNATLDLAGAATVELAGATEISAVGYRKRGRELVVGLRQGTVLASTANLPERTTLLVETPLGNCVVSGTVFEVSYRRLADQVTEELEVSCREGEVSLAGMFVATNADTLRAGGSIRFQVVNSVQRHCVYFPQLAVSGQDLGMSIGGGNAILLQDGAMLRGAMDAGPVAAPFFAFVVTAGSATVGGLEISAGMPAAFVKGDRVVMGDEGILPAGGIVRFKTPDQLIAAHDGDSLTIIGEQFESDVFLYPEKIVAGDWIRDNTDYLATELKMAPKEGVTDLIISLGPNQLIEVPEEVLVFLAESGVEVTLMPTDLAVAEYNKRVRDGKGATLGAALILEDYMNAEDYLNAARDAALLLIELAGKGGVITAGAPLPPPGFVPASGFATSGGSRFRPGGALTGGGTMTVFAPPPLNPYPVAPPPPIVDAPQSPGGTGSTCTKIITIEVPNYGALAFAGGGCGCCFSGYTGASSYVYPTKKVEIKVPCYVSDDGTIAKTPPLSLPSLPGAFVPGGCCLTF